MNSCLTTKLYGRHRSRINREIIFNKIKAHNNYLPTIYKSTIFILLIILFTTILFYYNPTIPLVGQSISLLFDMYDEKISCITFSSSLIVYCVFVCVCFIVSILMWISRYEIVWNSFWVQSLVKVLGSVIILNAKNLQKSVSVKGLVFKRISYLLFLWWFT